MTQTMSDGTPRLSICLLGTPEIHIAGTPLALNHLKARALLFFLAATGQSHTRDYLATLFWSEASSSEAHHSLRSTLYRLRQALRPSQADTALEGDGELLGLQPESYDCDLVEFRRLQAEGDEPALAKAVALYRGPFLQGFSLTDAPVFEEWVRSEDTRLSQACLDALDRLVAWAEAGEAWATAIGYALQMVQMDPLSETAQQRLMKLYLRQGEAASALRQYRQFENLLLQELELTPSPETRALLYDALRLQRSPKALTAFPARLSSRGPTALPFVGREPLLLQLSAISKEVQHGRGATVLLQGEGGIGKSRLLNELASRLIAGSPPWIVLQGACSPFDDLLSPGPFLDALQNGPAGDITELLDGQGSGVPDARGRFFWGVLQAIRTMIHSVPLLFVIDDLQWANSSTLNLFGFLSMRIHHLPVMLVGTVQHADSIPALHRLITLGRRRGELHLLPLAPLTWEAISALLHAYHLNSASLDTLAEWLHARTAGSPFLLAEVLAQLRAEGILQPLGGGWQLDTARWLRWRAAFTLPETTHDLVAWRLANLSPAARHLLDVLAVAGRPLPVAVLRAFPGIQAGSFPALVEDLTARGLLIEPPDATLALPHHLLREALLHRMSNLRRRTIDRQLAETLEAHASPEDDVVLRQIALYAVAGEDIDRARRYGLRALPGLPQEYMGAETMDYVHHLYDLLAPTASAGEMVQLTRALGTLHQTLGQLELASHWRQKNLIWAQKAGDLAAQADACFEMAELALVSNDYSAAARAAQEGLSIVKLQPLSSATEGLPVVRADHPLIGRGHRLLGAALAMDGSDLAAAEGQLREAVPALRQSGDQGDLCAALFELGNVAAQRGELPRALDFYEEAARAAEAGRVHYYLALARNNYAYHSLLLGRVAIAQESAARGVKVAEAYDLLAALLHLYSTQGEIDLYLGEWEEADASFRRGLALAEDLGSLERQAGYRGGLALAGRGRGDLSSAIRLFEEGLALIAEQGYWHLRARLQLGLAETLFACERLAEVEPPLSAALAIARLHHRTLLLVQGERLRARLLAAGGDWPAALGLFAETLEFAAGLELPLEIARVQAAWGVAALHHSPSPDEGHLLIAAARTILVAHNARADLALLP